MDKQPHALKRGEGESLTVLGTDVRFLCEAERTGRTFSAMEVTLPRDQGPPPHDHPWDEAYYVLAGEVMFLIGETWALYGEGDFLYAPGGVVHAFKGASGTPARVLVIDTPATAEGFFRDIDREVAGPADFGKIPAIGLRHSLRFKPAA
ncbi:MAG TPA: cupin domain-containing protein [Caulobacteraceae bacterium]|nr:cupin domain-containing protein [Caulobacteraceae bacterium]